MSITNDLLLNSRILKDVQILLVDNHYDSRELYAHLLEGCGAKVTSLGSIADALDSLASCIPAILICEMNFWGESVYPLIQQVRDLALTSGSAIPVLVTSTCPLKSLAQQLTVKVEAYLLKPVDIDYLVDRVWDLTLNTAYLPSIQDWMVQQRAEMSHCQEAAV